VKTMTCGDGEVWSLDGRAYFEGESAKVYKYIRVFFAGIRWTALLIKGKIAIENIMRTEKRKTYTWEEKWNDQIKTIQLK